MNFPVKFLRRKNGVISLISIAALLFYVTLFARTGNYLIGQSSKQNIRVISYDGLLFLVNNASSGDTDFRLAEEFCNKDFVNSHRLRQNHPCVIELIRRDYLHYPPSSEGTTLSLDSPDVVDPSSDQSSVVLPYLDNKTEGFFVECGAGDGEAFSNILFMERQLKWEGVLIEANCKYFSRILAKKRKVFALQVCLSLKPYTNKVLFYEDGVAGKIYSEQILKSEGEVAPKDTSLKLANAQCFPLYSILLSVGRTQIDYFSVDVEGSESQILMNVPWHKVNIKTLTVEVTSRNQADVDSITHFMQKHGYKKVKLMDGMDHFDLVFDLKE